MHLQAHCQSYTSQRFNQSLFAEKTGFVAALRQLALSIIQNLGIDLLFLIKKYF
jgi:hypothetical protein